MQPHFAAGNGLAKVRAGEMPRLSIVTPSFNQAQFLERTLCSVLDQAYPNLEYIVIDGGSTDGSRQIIERYAPHLTYWESLPDRGQAHAINKGFARATGQVRAWLNSDDIYLPAALARVAEYFQDPQLDFLFGQRQLLDAHDRLIQPVVIPYDDPFRFMFFGLGALNQEACFWRTELHAATGALDETYDCALDYEFFLRACWLARGRARRAPEFLGGFQVHPAQKSRPIDAYGTTRCLVEQRRARREFLAAHHLSEVELFVRGLYFVLARFIRTYGWRGFIQRFRPHRWIQIVRLIAVK